GTPSIDHPDGRPRAPVDHPDGRPRAPVDATVAGTTAVVEPDTHSPLESDPYRTRGKNRRIVAIGTAVAMVALGAIILVRVFSARDPVVDTPPAAASSSAPSSPSAAPSAPEVTPGGTASAPVMASAQPSAPAVSASAASSAKGPRVPHVKGS